MPIASNALGPDAYGVFATLLTAVAITGFADFGVGSAVVTAIAGSESDEHPGIVTNALSSLVAAGTAVAGAGVCLAALLPWQSLLGSKTQSTGDIRTAVIVFAVAVGCSVPAGVGQRVLLGLQRGGDANWWNLASRAVSLIGVVSCAEVHAPLWAYIVGGSGGATMVAIAQSAWVFWRMPALRPRRRLRHRETSRSLMRTGGLFLVLNVAVVFAYEADSFIVAGVRGAAAAATFAVALRIFAPVTGALTVAGQQMWPAMTEARRSGDLHWVSSRLKRTIQLTTLAAIAASLIFVAVGPVVCRHLLKAQLVPSRSLLLIFGAWTTYSLVASQLSYFLTAFGIIRGQVVMATAMTVSNVALSILLTKQIGLSGPLVGSLTSHFVCNGVPTLFLARRLLAAPHPADASASPT